MTPYSFEPDALDLPKGAYAKTSRRWLAHNGKRIFALTNGPFRPYLFPLFSPAGYLLGSESPADHPHHNSLWVGCDHVHMLMPTAPGRHEEYTYNFYVNETFQGRAPGRQIEIACESAETADGRFQIRQRIEWRGPAEWAAAEGRAVLNEIRLIAVSPGEQFHRIDVTCALAASGPAVRLGPTRHAFFNARVAETLTIGMGGVLSGPDGTTTAEAITRNGAGWVDFSGPAGGGARAGITMLPHPVRNRAQTWFVAGWGVMTVGAFRAEGITLLPGTSLETGCTYLLHDGDIPVATIESVASGLPEQVFPESEDGTS